MSIIIKNKAISHFINFLLHHEFIRFLVVGGLGTITNLVLFFFIADFLHFNKYLASSFVFLVAVTQNYILNHKWTFINHKSLPFSFKTYLKFICVSLIGLGVNLLVLKIVDDYFNFSIILIAQALGILAGTLVNFIGSKFIVYVIKNKT